MKNKLCKESKVLSKMVELLKKKIKASEELEYDN